MKKRTFAILSVLLAACLMLAACGSEGSPMYEGKTAEMTYGGQTNAGSTSPTALPAADSNQKDSVPQNQKLIKTLKISMETLDFDGSLSKLNTLVFEKGGYVESSTIGGTGYNSRSRRTAQFVIRIPADQLDQAEAELSALGNVTSSTSEISDVTLTWADTESRIKALEAQRDSLLSMLEKAENLSDLLQIQDHLTEVEYKLESAASQMRVLENQVSYSTIRLNLEEVKIYTEEEPETFGQRISRTFKDSLESVGEFFSDLVVFVLGNLPAILCWAVFIVLAVLGIRKLSRNRKKKKAARPVVPLQEPPKEFRKNNE
ncbi:MAG: DUF4349 domain-containing protein [Lachnospiraceae bacterium]|nr:DUF4349 domain-containing protein [Lachnospiraceae bacterium]